MARGGPLVALALACVVGLAGCGSSADGVLEKVGAAEPGGKPAYGDTFIDVLLGNVSGLIPNIVSDAASSEVGNLIYSGLVSRDKDLNFIGDLAESWTFSRTAARSPSSCGRTRGGTTAARSRRLTSCSPTRP